MTYKGVSKGRTVYVKCKLYDPYHPLKGRYLQLDFDYSKVPLKNYPDLSADRKNFIQDFTPLYVVLSEDKNEVINVTVKKPADNSLYLKSKFRYDYNDDIYLHFPFDKYYIQENLAKKAEDYIRANPELNIRLELSVDKEGNARIVKMLSGDKKIEDLIK